MKYFTSAVIAALTLALSTAAFADNHNHGRNARSRHHEGENYRGHRLHQVHGHWGYYQPRNGTNVFISIPL
ncbi:MAG: hypothetical protein IAI49_02470 [Candidatus Eremiobacteraeota bacterium]|nr:hypothetical protein [Candidatus Eremiobacteraeota bacterium]